MGNAPDALLRLIDRLDQDRKVFLSGDYKEEQLRAEFLNPFFIALGWDMDNNRACPRQTRRSCLRARREARLD